MFSSQRGEEEYTAALKTWDLRAKGLLISAKFAGIIQKNCLVVSNAR
jgi:hypothetical protein